MSTPTDRPAQVARHDQGDDAGDKLPTLHQAARACAPGHVLAARHGRTAMAVLRLPDGRVFAVPDRCPHAGVPLSQGFLDDNQRLVCPVHGWEFEMPSGTCVLGRAEAPLEVTQVVKRRRHARSDNDPQLF
jgi:nitrite reductase/ring-hydroxylating ferredoxin subunit